MAGVAAGKPLTILIAALGGEGGGVLMNWLVEAATRKGLAVQATSVPGVAQRTGSTSYYIEMMREPSPHGTHEPVFSLVPMPARVDVVVASEFVEAARMLERGFVSPKRTTLITSTSRVLTTAEKMPMGDGRFDAGKVETAARALAQRLIQVDLDALAREHKTMVSATMFGALAACDVLPFGRSECEAVMGEGRPAAASRAGFAAAFAAVRAGDGDGKAVTTIQNGVAALPLEVALPHAITSRPELATLARPVLDVVALGVERTQDFQDAAYSDLFLDRVSRLVAAAPSQDAVVEHALQEAARRLALWMAYEDIPRVADLKTRPDRFAGIRREAEMTPGQILVVEDFLKPGPEEIAAMLPVALGERMMRRVARGKSFPFLGTGLKIRSNGIVGHAVMRVLARFRNSRRGSLRYREEQARIETWLAAMEKSLPRAPSFASALAELPSVLKGYGETQARGNRSYARIMAALVTPALASGEETNSAPALRNAIAAALADPEHAALDALLGPRSTPAVTKQIGGPVA